MPLLGCGVKKNNDGIKRLRMQTSWLVSSCLSPALFQSGLNVTWLASVTLGLFLTSQKVCCEYDLLISIFLSKPRYIQIQGSIKKKKYLPRIQCFSPLASKKSFSPLFYTCNPLSAWQPDLAHILDNLSDSNMHTCITHWALKVSSSKSLLCAVRPLSLGPSSQSCVRLRQHWGLQAQG